MIPSRKKADKKSPKAKSSKSAKQSIFKRVVKFVAKTVVGLFLLSILWVVALKWINPPITFLMLKRVAQEGYGLKKDWVDIDEVPEYVPLAMLMAEDQKFLNHNGFDVQAIEKAWKKNKTGKKVKGGSTITQQTAKNVFLWPHRSWLRKGLEAYFTVLIENIWGKKRILEVYINVVEMGKGVYGVKAASREFFNRDINKITRWQASILAAVLPSPTIYSAKSPGSYVQKRAGWVSGQLGHYPKGYLSFD